LLETLTLSAIIHSVKDGIISTNELEQITTVNDAAQRFLQIPREELIGRQMSHVTSVKELIGPEDFQNKIVQIGNLKLNTNKTSISQGNNKVGNVITFQDITEIQKIEQKYRLENETKGFTAKNYFHNIVGSSLIIQRTIEQAKKFALSDSTVLILGQTGTGKELFAQSIHNHSKRKSFPFLAINCAALPEALLESELFGYEDGAFTGASKKGKKGLFEIAHNGTIFLDEINSISPYFQARLLRVLQEKEVVRIGGNRVIPVNIRVIAASNEDLFNLVKANKFRPDLYYRINVLQLGLPSLRDRSEDIFPLTQQFLLHQNSELYHKLGPFLEHLCQELQKYQFPGNVRELYNILERFSVLCGLSDNFNLDTANQILADCMQQTSPINRNTKVEFNLQDDYKDTMVEAERAVP
ncbi:sigma-54 interaction domain-containing protein, partial [Alicyclobacillus acidoterrestris]